MAVCGDHADRWNGTRHSCSQLLGTPIEVPLPRTVRVACIVIRMNSGE